MGRTHLLIALLAALPLCGAPLVDQSFEMDATALRAAGWRLPAGASVEAGGRVGAQCLRVACPEKKGYAELFVPVEQGHIYTAKAWVRCENVANDEASTYSRGAVLFCQFADKDKQWRPGGSFPKGLHDTHDWQQLEVKYTAAIPEGVAFIQLMVGVEGTGTAWFDGIELKEITEWDTPKAISPTDGAAVDSKRPLLKWEANLPTDSYQLELSPSPQFPADTTRRQLVWAGEARPDAPLVPGTWYWRLQTISSSARLPATIARRFTVPEDAANWPPRFVPAWTNDLTPQPVLAAQLAPTDWVTEVEATIGGQVATVERTGDRLAIRATAKLPDGVLDVQVTARGPGGQKVGFHDVFCHKTPATTITFRQDGIMLLDGKPFFPMGSYRDPSDTRTDFAGLHEAGFNVTHDYYFENTDRTVPEARDYLRAADAAGLKVFLGLGRPSIRRNDIMGWKRWVGELMDEPGLLTWYMMDEPMCQEVPHAAFVGLQQAIRQMDSGHPSSLLLARIAPVTDFQRAYAATCDVLWCDPYPVPDHSLLTVAQKAEACREAAGPGKPFWVVLQGFDWRYAREGKKALEKYGQEITSPTSAETRAMAHLALSTGTQGLIWYWSPNSIYHIQRQAPTVWQGICETVQELNRLQSFLIAPRAPADDLALPAPFRSWSRAADGKRVLAVVNASDEPSRLVLPGNHQIVDWRTGQPPEHGPIAAWGTAIYTWNE